MSLIGREIYRDVPLPHPTPVAAAPETRVPDHESEAQPPAFRRPAREPATALRRSN